MAVDRASWLFPPFGGNPREVRLWLGLSRALVERAGHAEGLPPDVSLPDDQVYALDSKPRLEAFRRAATIEERILPKGDPRVAATLNNLAEALCRARRFDEALAINERVLEMFVDTYGLTSVNVATVRSNRGECLVNAGRPNEALEPLQTAISTTERDVGKYVIASALLGYSLTALGRALVDVGRARDAEPVLQRAVRLREENKAYAFLLAESRFALARAVWDSGADRSQAVALARRARSGYVNAPPAWDPKVIDGWLATHKL
jgi:tetratricopeptide (TPR) repeat protein